MSIFCKDDFYPRPRVEGDTNGFTFNTPQFKFLSTPSRRGRPDDRQRGSVGRHFYPRPRVEGDPYKSKKEQQQNISIHALA